MPSNTVLVACKVFAPEISLLGVDQARVHYLDQGLHRYPDDLRFELSKVLKQLEQDNEVHSAILAYGYCGGGLEGLSSTKLSFTLPLAHDCIPLLLGRIPSVDASNPDTTFYLSAGWVEYGKTPLTEFWECSKRFGVEDARWVACEMVKNYREVSVIDNGTPLTSNCWMYAHEMSELCGLECTRTQGNLGWLTDLIKARQDDRVITVQPGQTLCIQKDWKV